jgi:hypothetical protein
MAVTVTWIEFNGSNSAWPAKTGKGRPAIGAQTAIKAGAGQVGISGSYPIKNLNFGAVDSTNVVPAYYPIPAGSNSYAKYFKLQFSGSFTTIGNIKLWMSNGLLKTGESILFSGNVAKGTTISPSTTSILTTHPGSGTFIPKAIPTSVPTTANICSQNTTSSTLPINTIMGAGYAGEIYSSPGYYSGVRASCCVMQLQTTTAIEAGAVNTKTFSVIYDRT